MLISVSKYVYLESLASDSFFKAGAYSWKKKSHNSSEACSHFVASKTHMYTVIENCISNVEKQTMTSEYGQTLH